MLIAKSTSGKDKCFQGDLMYKLAERLFPICRSITGNGVRKTLNIIKEYIPELIIREVETGTKVMDWEVPQEWNIKDAYVEDQNGNRVIDFQRSNLHVVGYSVPVNTVMNLEQLQQHLFSIPENPNAIPYVTSYYNSKWGFCLSHNDRMRLNDGDYKVVIDAEKKNGSLTWAECYFPGSIHKDIFISSYICHPSMANNELSGPVLLVALANWVKKTKNKYGFHFVLAPETIGPHVVMGEYLSKLKKNTVAAYNLTCVGDDRAVSYVPSRRGNTINDKAVRHVLKYFFPDYIEYEFLRDRGSDERQYCSPNVDLPMVSIMRSKYGTYPEYHTSLDNMSVISSEGLQKSFDLHCKVIELVQYNKIYESNIIGEPHFAKYGIDINLVGSRELSDFRRHAQNILMCTDGSLDVIDIAERLDVYYFDLVPVLDWLEDKNLISEID